MKDEQPAAWCLEVIEGANRGARIVLGPGRYRLGSDADDDIVLADAAAAPCHANLELSAARILLRTFCDGLRVGRQKLSSGAHLRLRRNAVFRIGGTVVRIAPTAAREQALAVRRFGLVPLLSIFAIVGAAVGVAAFVGSAGEVRAAVHFAPRSREVMSADAAAAATQTRVAATTLAGKIVLSTEQGAVVAAGVLAPTERPAWGAIHSWFDGRFGRDVALIDKTTDSPPRLVPLAGIAAISLLPVPNVITSEGQRYTEGAVLSGGWVIEAITLHGVTLTRGREKIEVAS